MRPQRAARRALADQLLAVLQAAEGFPLSTGQVAANLGDRLVLFPPRPAVVGSRPACWPDVLDDPGDPTEAPCVRCAGWHRQPVWRRWTAEDIRPLLGRLAQQGAIDRLVLDACRSHYWHTTSRERQP